MYVLIPAAGNGSRFKEAGYEEPKPVIDVLGKPMIEQVIRNVTPDIARVIIITRAEHRIDAPEGCTNLVLGHETEGAVSTLLEAKHLIDADVPLVIANSDQLVDFDPNDFVNTDLDGRLVTFQSSKPHHSYVETKAGVITRIVEKEVISNQAVTGVYYFRSSKQFFAACEAVIQSGVKTKGEFYVSTVIEYLVTQGKQIGVYGANSTMLGTPEELQHFLVAAKVSRML